MTVFPVIRAFSCVCDALSLRVVALTGEALTFPKTLKFEKRSPGNETIFLDHYEWLLDWARQLTQGAAGEAEDLVQDLYVRFVQMKAAPSLVDEDAIRAYLYTALKNLFISKKLRSGRDAVSGLLAVDFDSVEYAVAGVDRGQLLHVRSDLAGICEYACVRRKTSRAGSVLILRYFLGYLSTEVMALLRVKRSHVDTLVETARLEAKAYLARPGVLSFLSRGERKAFPFPRYLPEEPEALFDELQRRIFSEPEGTCSSPNDLRHRLLQPEGAAFTTAEAAHLASCRDCLGLATRCLGLQDLTLRSFNGDDPPAGAGSQAGKPSGQPLKKLRRKLRETFEHRPKKLQIVVDGEVRGVQTITAPSSNLQIALPPLSEPGFLEVLSEQGLGLLYFDLQQSNVEIPGAQSAEVDLSDARHLSVSVTLVGGAPLIELSYYDPLFASLRGMERSAVSEAAVDLSAHTDKTDRVLGSKESRWTSICSALRSWRPWLIGALASLGVLSALTVSRRSAPSHAPALLSPSQVLSQAANKAAAIVPTDGAVRQVFTLEVRSKNGTMLSTSVVDSLSSANLPLRKLSLRNQGSLRATHWVTREGQAHDLVPRPPANHKPAALISKAWQHPPDAQDFKRLAGDAPLALRRLDGGYEVSFSRSGVGDTPVVEGRLDVSQTTLLPYAETLLVQSGEDARTYRFQQTSYEVLSAEHVSENDFVPDFGVTERSAPTTLGNVDMAHLTLATLRTLQQQTQEVQAAVDVQRSEDGGVDVTGVLHTTSDVQSITRALRLLEGGDTLHIKLHSSDEARKVPVSHGGEVEPTLSAEEGRVPLDPMIRELLSAHSGRSGITLDAQVLLAARDLLERGARIHRNAWTVDQIATQDFGVVEIKAMSGQDRRLWLALLAEPLKLCDSDLTATSTLLLPSGADDATLPDIPASSVYELRIAADSLRQHAERLDELLARGLAISTEDVQPQVSPPELLAELVETQRAERKLTTTVQRLQQVIR